MLRGGRRLGAELFLDTRVRRAAFVGWRRRLLRARRAFRLFRRGWLNFRYLGCRAGRFGFYRLVGLVRDVRECGLLLRGTNIPALPDDWAWPGVVLVAGVEVGARAGESGMGSPASQ